MLDAKDRIIKAKVELQKEKPFFAYLLMRLKIAEKNDLEHPTICVSNDGHLYYTPEFINGLSDSQLKGVLCHEVLHIALQHLERIQLNSRDHEVYNIAIDLAVNYILQRDGFNLPDGIIPSGTDFYLSLPNGTNIEINNLDKKNADQIYNELIKQLPKKDQKQNKAGDDRPKGFDKHKYGDKNEPTEQIKQRVKQNKQLLTSAVEFAKQRGSLPAGVKRYVKELLDVKLNWKQLLYNYITNELPSDYTYNRPSRRSESVGVFLPSLKRENIDLVVSVDTSGSVNHDEIREFLTEIAGILKSFTNLKMTLIVCDSEIHEVYKIDNTNAHTINSLTLSGGGGTDHEPIFKYISEYLPNARLYVSLTDGYTYLPKETPSINTVWVINNNGRTDLPFGTVIKLDR